jgi:F-type H+-transporting ATPase subunit delta
MNGDELAKTYALGLAQLAWEKGILSEVEAQLVLVQKTTEECAEFNKVMLHPGIEVSTKVNLVRQIFQDVEPLLINFLILLVKKGRWSYLPGIIHAFTEVSLDIKGIVQVDLEVAKPIDAMWEQELEKVLESKLHKQVRLRVKHNPDLLGGVRLKVKDKVYDGSLRAGLESMGKKLFSA